MMTSLLESFPWLAAEAPSLVVVLPMIMAAAVALLRKEGVAWIVTLVTTALVTLLAGVLLHLVISSGPMSYAMGGWTPPFGIEYRIDALSAPVLLLIAAMGFLATIFAKRSVGAEIQPKKRAPFYAAFLVCLTGLLGMVTTGDAFNLFVFLEISSISTYMLVAMGSGRDRRALTSAYNYLILGTIGATFFVIGVGFLYMETGSLNMADIAERLQGRELSRVTQTAFAFIVIGMGLKLAMFPLHMWLPGAYAYSPSFVTVFLASTATKAALYVIIRFLFTIFDPSPDYWLATLTWVLGGLGVIGMLAASLQALFQSDARRLLAFSSVAQVGYMLLGVGMATTLGLTAGIFHLINHAVIKGALFIVLGALWYRFGITKVSDFRGMGKVMPVTMAGFTLAGLSLIGVPGTAGFQSKLALMQASFDHGWWWAGIVIVVSSVIALLYIGRMIETAYLKPAPTHKGEALERTEAPLTMLIPLWVLVAASILIGIFPGWVRGLAEAAAQAVTGGL